MASTPVRNRGAPCGVRANCNFLADSVCDSVSLPILLSIFAVSAAAVWIAGTYLSDSTDILSQRWGWGEALGGMILLAVVTNLPEIAITGAAALNRDLGIAVGNILGGIAIQTVVLVFLDLFGLGKSASLTYRADSLTLVIEGALVVAVLTIALMGTQMPESMIYDRITPAVASIAIIWIAGLWLVDEARKDLPWRAKERAFVSQAAKAREDSAQNEKRERMQGAAKTWPIIIFAIGAIATLIAGVALEESGNAIAKQVGMSGVLFGATILAAVTALPEVSTGFASVKLGDYEMAVSDIFGGNAFLPVLFLLATLLSGEAILPKAGKIDIYLTALGILLTAVYMIGLIFRPQKQFARMGIDSGVVLLLYVLGLLGLFAVTRG